jgi:hypothetical protein
MSKKWKWISILSGVALTAAVIGVWFLGTTMTASAAERTAEDLKTLTQSTTEPGLLGEGYLAHGGWGRRGFGDGSIDYQQLLADALDITVEKLEGAYDTARVAAIEKAVELGLITQEQADEMVVWGERGKWFGGMRGIEGLFGRGRGPAESSGSEIDENALLAEALGITTEALQTAREQANQAALEQAIAEGLITQEQADEMAARKQTAEALQSYLGRDALLAQALGMTVEELQAANEQGKSLSDLLSEQGLDALTVRENMQAAHEAALAQAVEDGVITQEQADEMSDRMSMGGPGMRSLDGRGHPPGPGGFGGRGGFERRRPSIPDTDGDDGTDGAHFYRPGRMNQDSNAL